MISVCIATYNGEKYICEQLNSILKQLSASDEVIISDDGSKDKTLEIIKSLNDNRIIVLQNQGKHGFTHNFENAIKHAKGDIVFLSDQDDIWTDDKVKSFLEVIEPGFLVISDAWVCSSTLEKKCRLSEVRSFKKSYIENLYKGMFLGSTMAFTKELIPYFLPIPNVLGHDMWFALLSVLENKLVYIDKPLLLYRRHDETVTTSGSNSNKSLWFKLSYRLNFLVYTLWRYFTRKYNKLRRIKL